MEEFKSTTKCYICEQEFNQYDLKDHFLECDQEHECETCHKVFQTENLLENHKVVHDEMNKDHLKIQHIHDGHKDFNCESCGKSFSSKYYLEIHYRTIHKGHKDENINSNYICYYCDISFQNENNLTEHGLEKHVCDICCKKFKQTSHLRRHIKDVHEKIKDFMCDYCSKRFKNNAAVKRHQEDVHTQNKKWLCDQCNKRFSSKQTLQNHNRQFHKSGTMYICGICNKSYQSMSHLNRHTKAAHLGLG